jgi:hypothetical protein
LLKSLTGKKASFIERTGLAKEYSDGGFAIILPGLAIKQ